MVKTKSQNEAEKVLENPEALREKLFQTEDFFVKYRNVILGVIAAIVLGIAGYVFYKQRQSERNEEAQKEMYPAVFYFEADSLNKALEGDLKNPGLLSIADEYGDTQAGKLANFYVGSIYLKQGKFEEAVNHLKKFETEDALVQARGYSLTGDAYMELNNLDEAIKFYDKSVDHNPNPQFTPQYIMKAALAYELKNDFKSAEENYEKLINEFPKSPQVSEARKLKARAEAIQNTK